MDIFKLFFEHDLRLDQLRERKPGNSGAEVTTTIEDFMKPDPTYSKFYFTGTRLEENPEFGLDRLVAADTVKEALIKSLSGYSAITKKGVVSLDEALETISFEEPLILAEGKAAVDYPESLILEPGMYINQKRSELAEALEKDLLVLYKEKAHHGYDLHLFSKKNLYSLFFYPFRELTNEQFRFFSINGKRMRSERMFYFETWSLNRPPHGAEEVFRSTEI